MIGVPLEDSGAALGSKRCSGCGHWAALQALRCDRCGRVLLNPGAAARLRRNLELTDALPSPPSPPPPRPIPEPEWKQELQARLAGYRDRTDSPSEPPPSQPLQSRGRQLAAQQAPALRTRLAESRLPLPDRFVPAAPKSAVLPDVAPPIVDLRPAGETTRRQSKSQRPAPLSIRAIAGAMDLGVALLATGLFAGILHQVEQVALTPEQAVPVMAAAFALNLTFYLLCFLLYAGRTAGMSWLGLSVLNIDGDPPAAAQRRSRAFGTLLSLAALGVGFVWAAADEQGLTWHDRMSKTFVSQDED